MATIGEELFNINGPDGENHSDIWDDTALIEAYDNAVSIVKEHMSIKSKDTKGEETTTPSETHMSSKKKHKKHRRQKQKAKMHPNDKCAWRVGQHCQAVFTEDSEVYEAIIMSVDGKHGTCVVRYIGYGNEEEHLLADLLPSDLADNGAGSVSAHSDKAYESEGGVDWHPRSRSSPRSNATSHHAYQSGGHPSFPPHMPSMPPNMFPPQFAMPPMGPPGMSAPWSAPSFPSFPNFPTNSVPPMMPAAPPGLDDLDEDVCSDKEALYTMLMSWYMSGYHTGYYTGLQQKKRFDSRKTSSFHHEDPNTTSL